MVALEDRPTKKQLMYLRILGFDGKAPETKQEMRMLIDHLRKQQRAWVR